MKLVISIVHKDDADNVIEALIREGQRATKLSTMGGFLREGNATILIGAHERDVPQVLEIIKANTHEHRERAPALLRFLNPQSGEVIVGAAIVFVLNLEGFHRF